MRTLIPALLGTTLLASIALAAPARAETGPSPEQIAQIDTLLAAMTCEVAPDNIETEDHGGFDLDDVQCADGQYDIKLNANFEVTEKRKE